MEAAPGSARSEGLAAGLRAGAPLPDQQWLPGLTRTRPDGKEEAETPAPALPGANAGRIAAAWKAAAAPGCLGACAGGGRPAPDRLPHPCGVGRGCAGAVRGGWGLRRGPGQPLVPADGIADGPVRVRPVCADRPGGGDRVHSRRALALAVA